jgi:hypothetical protein
LGVSSTRRFRRSTASAIGSRWRRWGESGGWQKAIPSSSSPGAASGR